MRINLDDLGSLASVERHVILPARPSVATTVCKGSHGEIESIWDLALRISKTRENYMRIHEIILPRWRVGALVRRGNGEKKRDLQHFLQASLVAESPSLAKKQLDIGARGNKVDFPLSEQFKERSGEMEST